MSSAHRLTFALCLTVLLYPVNRVFALSPPSPDQVREYKADGSWSGRLAAARDLGNHQLDAELAMRFRARMVRQSALAAGRLVPDVEPFAPPSGWSGGLPSKGTVNTLVLLVDFPDYPHGAAQTVADVQGKFFGNGTANQYPYESVRNYYQRSSYGQLNIQGNVLGWYRAANNRSFYQDLGSAGEETLIMEAMNHFDAQGHDFTQYDNDGDGRLDSFFLKWTGPDNGWANFWWAKQMSWSGSSPFSQYRIDGKRLRKFVWSWYATSEGDLFSPRVDIHETGHLLGLPDYYDYDDSVGPRGGVGDLDMMDANWGDHCCFSKAVLEWLTPTVIVNGAQTLTLNPSGTSKDCVLIMPGATAGDYFDEYFMAQFRKRSVGNDSASYPTDGLVIWHIDATLNGSNSNYRYNNSDSSHKLIRLMEADGLEEIETNNSRVDSGDFYRPPAVFSPVSTPRSHTYAGALTGIHVDQLGTPGTTMSARFRIVTGAVLEAAGTMLTDESCGSGNNAIDPNETVTVAFGFLNSGNIPTGHITATLQTTGGVGSNGGSQDYGVIAPGADPIIMPFTFKAEGECGSTLTATLAVYNNGAFLRMYPFTIPLGPGGGQACCFTSTSVGDFDGDGDTDLEDFGRFQACLSGSFKPQTDPACTPARMDHDGDVDAADLAMFERCMSGPGVTTDGDCRANP